MRRNNTKEEEIRTHSTLIYTLGVLFSLLCVTTFHFGLPLVLLWLRHPLLHVVMAFYRYKETSVPCILIGRSKKRKTHANSGRWVCVMNSGRWPTNLPLHHIDTTFSLGIHSSYVST
ncbi:hypothetical protein Dimus_008521 [Dionaea muscipula]